MAYLLHFRSPAFVVALFAVSSALATTTRAQPVDVRLVLAVDSSSSVSIDEFYLQLEGYAAAFSHPNLLAAIRSGPNRAIAVTLFEWSGEREQRVNYPWRRLDDAESLDRFARQLALAPRLVVGGETAIGAAIEFARARFENSDFAEGRAVIDISGDGTSNRGIAVETARDRAVAAGITINGLAILNEEPDLDDYYRRAVVGGSGAFVLSARDYADFAEAILRKLVREISNIADAGPRSSDDRGHHISNIKN